LDTELEGGAPQRREELAAVELVGYSLRFNAARVPEATI
jgi:hypothetical protein